jgi:hypothetical protein
VAAPFLILLSGYPPFRLLAVPAWLSLLLAGVAFARGHVGVGRVLALPFVVPVVYLAWLLAVPNAPTR